ncbi:MAG TPA: L,D-transpeptidase family protein, partial [Cytophagaceae bacterium]|nr:L,D-transpeptidase family protein [Cytophagaceae bacterium]
VRKPTVPIAIGNEKLVLDSLTVNVYKANNHNSFWNDSSECHHIINLLSDSRFDGLRPQDYGIPKLDSMFKACFMVKKQKNDTLYWKLELAVTQNYLRYLNHLRFGKTNPEEIYKDWDYKRDSHLPYTPAEFSKFLIQNPDALLKELRPQYAMYSILRNVLYTVDSIGQTNTFEWDAIPYPGKDLKPGDSSAVIVKIKHRLLSVGLGHEDPATAVFDDDMLTALNYFQQHVGLTPNGKVDKATIAKLNFNLQEIKDVVTVNMERCRWLLKGELPESYIIVNIADYYLRVYKNSKQVYKTKVVVGATNKETPLFHSQMTTVEFNPHWTVPISIIETEILPKLKTDPTYLSRNNMELLKGDSVIQVTDFSPYTKNNFPFVIRQKPGVDNSLGLVKFLFPNTYSVYFHDTPAKSFFEKDVRAFSHGCVRVYKPLDLAALLLSDQGVTPKYISEIIKSGENTPITLKTKIPVIITYWTCFTDEKNQVFFFKDIYGRDKLILTELNK